MNYYIAVEIDTKPFIVFVSTKLTEGSLVVSENNLPKIQFGVCPLKIVGGELVQRTEEEMDLFESEFNKNEILKEQFNLIAGINSGTFTYDSQTFPMDERSRIFYQAFDRARGLGDVKCMTATGRLYGLDNSNIDDFLDAYFLRLRTLSQPNV